MNISLNRIAVALSLALLTFAVGCQTTPDTEAKRDALVDEAQTAAARLEAEDPSLKELLKTAYGHVVFPTVGKGGVIVGGAFGRGTVYEQGKMIGWADLTQATVGAQLGGQSFTEIVVFENKEALERFKNNQLTFSANASAVAIKAGAAAAAKYENGVAIFTKPNGGLMFEASVGGQKFTFKAASEADGKTVSDTKTTEKM